MVRLTLCAAMLVALVWLRPDLDVGSDLFHELLMGRTPPTKMLVMAGQLGLIAIGLIWVSLPALFWIGRWATQERHSDETDHFRSRMDAALKPRRTRLD